MYLNLFTWCTELCSACASSLILRLKVELLQLSWFRHRIRIPLTLLRYSRHRPRTLFKEIVPFPDCESLGIAQNEVGSIAGERDVWDSPAEGAEIFVLGLKHA